MAEPQAIALDALAELIDRRPGSERLLVAVAGPPGSGKSHLADALEARLNARKPGLAAVLPMDGYHYDDRILEARGLRPRKGAPDTFDVAGLLHMLQRLRRNEEAEIAVPVFDRDLEIARAGARLIPRTVRSLIVEGNYLLLRQPPWNSLRDQFDITVMVSVPEEVLRQRLTARWAGYGLPAETIEAKVAANDLPNGRVVIAESSPADYVILS